MSRVYRTSQHINVYEKLVEKGRYVLPREFVCKELVDDDECKALVIRSYDWLAQNMPNQSVRPSDADYPIWLSLNTDSNYPPAEDGVVLEFEIPDEYVATISVEKWGAILDYRYIPTDEDDAQRHRKLVGKYGTSDAKAYMTGFYPEIKREITESWKRVFDTAGLLPEMCYGLVWELRKEWLCKNTGMQSRGCN